VVKIPVADPKLEPWVQGAVMLAGSLIVLVVTGLILNRAARKIQDAPALKHIVAVER